MAFTRLILSYADANFSVGTTTMTVLFTVFAMGGTTVPVLKQLNIGMGERGSLEGDNPTNPSRLLTNSNPNHSRKHTSDLTSFC